MKHLLVRVCGVLALSLGVCTWVLVTGCGGSGDDDDSSSSHYSCCLNGAYYGCPSSDAVSNCNLNTGPGSCTRDSSQDSTCHF